MPRVYRRFLAGGVSEELRCEKSASCRIGLIPRWLLLVNPSVLSFAYDLRCFYLVCAPEWWLSVCPFACIVVCLILHLLALFKPCPII